MREKGKAQLIAATYIEGKLSGKSEVGDTGFEPSTSAVCERKKFWSQLSRRAHNPEELVRIQRPLPLYFQQLTQKSTPEGSITRTLAPHLGGIYDHYFKGDGFCLSVYQEDEEVKSQHNHLLQPASQQVHDRRRSAFSH